MTELLREEICGSREATASKNHLSLDDSDYLSNVWGSY